jgi:hypothetical protein
MKERRRTQPVENTMCNMDPPPPLRFIDAQAPAAPYGAPTFAFLEIVARQPRVDKTTIAQRAGEGNARRASARRGKGAMAAHAVAFPS